MGMGLSIQVVALEWPTEDVPTRCLQCGSRLLLTRHQRPAPPDILALESEQLCPVCGTSACEENEGIKTVPAKNRNRDFFSAFRK